MRELKYTDMSLTDEQLALIGIKSKPETERYIQVGDVRYTLDELNRIGTALLERNLSDDQQVVLAWWVKKLNEEREDADPLGVICAMQSYGLRDETIYDAAANLTPEQQFQVLAAFAEWGSKEDK